MLHLQTQTALPQKVYIWILFFLQLRIYCKIVSNYNDVPVPKTKHSDADENVYGLIPKFIFMTS